MATFNWQILQLERDLLPENMNGAIVIAHWNCTATQTEGSGDDAVNYSASNYGTVSFTPDPAASDYTPYADVTEEMVKTWVFANGVEKAEVETSLQANIDAQITPTTAAGTPWA